MSMLVISRNGLTRVRDYIGRQRCHLHQSLYESRTSHLFNKIEMHMVFSVQIFEELGSWDLRRCERLL